MSSLNFLEIEEGGGGGAFIRPSTWMGEYQTHETSKNGIVLLAGTACLFVCLHRYYPIGQVFGIKQTQTSHPFSLFHLEVLLGGDCWKSGEQGPPASRVYKQSNKLASKESD